MATTGEIKGYNDLKERAARLGIVLFGISYDRPIPDRDHDLSSGIEICDIIAEGKRFSSPLDVKTFEDLAFVEQFKVLEAKQHHKPKESSELAKDAPTVRKTLEKLLHSQTVSPGDLQKSSHFFRRVYDTY